MSVIKNVYSVNQIKQLIDLNNNKTNFDLTFEVKSLNNKPFRAVVLSEAQLNSGNPIEYKEVREGYISGNIVNDKGVYQNYFLLLKSDDPQDCEVTLSIRDIPLNPELQRFQQEQHQQQQMQQQMQHQQQQQIQMQKQEEMRRQEELKRKEQEETNRQYQIRNREAKALKSAVPEKPSGTNWVLIIGICIIVGIGLWYMYSTSKKNASQIPVQTEPTVFKYEPQAVQYTQRPVLPVELPQQQNLPINNQVLNDVTPQETPAVLNTNPPLAQPKKNDVLFSRLNNYFGN